MIHDKQALLKFTDMLWVEGFKLLDQAESMTLVLGSLTAAGALLAKQVLECSDDEALDLAERALGPLVSDWIIEQETKKLAAALGGKITGTVLSGPYLRDETSIIEVEVQLPIPGAKPWGC